MFKLCGNVTLPGMENSIGLKPRSLPADDRQRAVICADMSPIGSMDRNKHLTPPISNKNATAVKNSGDMVFFEGFSGSMARHAASTL